MFHKLMCAGTTNLFPYFEFVANRANDPNRQIFAAGLTNHDTPYGQPASWWRVEINGKPFDKPLNELRFSADDVVRVYHDGAGGVFTSNGQDIIKEFRGALPTSGGSRAFYQCYGLKTVPLSTFSNLTGLHGSFAHCFRDSGLEAVPPGLFSSVSCVEANFYSAFCDCRNLKSIDIDEFAGFKVIDDMSYMFSGSSVRNLHLRFTLREIADYAVWGVASGLPEGAITVYCPKGSNFAKKMKEKNPNVTVVEE